MTAGNAEQKHAEVRGRLGDGTVIAWQATPDLQTQVVYVDYDHCNSGCTREWDGLPEASTGAERSTLAITLLTSEHAGSGVGAWATLDLNYGPHACGGWMRAVTHWIAGLPLPGELVEVIQAGKWRPPTDPQVYIDTFGELPDCPLFYDLDEMGRQNRSWQGSSVEEEFGYLVEGSSVGIDPARSVLIGDLCPDMPIALDFRNSENSPSVLYRTQRDIITWVQVADSVSKFLERLKISPESYGS